MPTLASTQTGGTSSSANLAGRIAWSHRASTRGDQFVAEACRTCRNPLPRALPCGGRERFRFPRRGRLWADARISRSTSRIVDAQDTASMKRSRRAFVRRSVLFHRDDSVFERRQRDRGVEVVRDSGVELVVGRTGREDLRPLRRECRARERRRSCPLQADIGAAPASLEDCSSRR